MKTIFVDANVFLRFFLLDDPIQHEKAVRFFGHAAAGKVQLLTGPPVLFEIAWTLRAGFGQSKEKVLDVLSAIASMPGLRFADGDLVEKAIGLARQSGQAFADAYIAAGAQAAGADEIATFNRKHFERMGVGLCDF